MDKNTDYIPRLVWERDQARFSHIVKVLSGIMIFLIAALLIISGAFLYYIRQKDKPEPNIIDVPSYSEAPAEAPQRFYIKSGSEFAEVVNGKKIDDVLPLFDEMVQSVAAVEPALYNAFIRELKNILP